MTGQDWPWIEVRYEHAGYTVSRFFRRRCPDGYPRHAFLLSDGRLAFLCRPPEDQPDLPAALVIGSRHHN